MKKILLFIALAVTFNSIAQTQTTTFFTPSHSIWIEDFSGYTNNTGITTNGGAIQESGDYNNSFTKWRINSSAVNANNTIIAGVQNLNADNIFYPTFSAANTGGDLTWESEIIDVNAYDLTHLSLVLETSGNLSENEYIDVYWQVVNVGNFILIDETGGHTVAGSSTEECFNTFKIFKDLTTTGADRKVRIRVVFRSENIDSVLKLKKVEILGRSN